MTTKLILRALVVCGALFGTGLSAHAGDWQGPFKVVSITVEGEDNGNRVYVSLGPGVQNTENCTNFANPMVRIHGSTKKGTYHVAQLTTALAAGSQVNIALFGCDDWSRPVVSGITIYP